MSTKSKRILFLSWKDITHPSAGGAELLTDTLAQHLCKTHDVTYFTSAYPGAQAVETMHGYTVLRRGSIYTTYIHACIWWHIQAASKHWECIIDQVHGFPFFAILYSNHPPVITLVMEVAGDLWNNISSPLQRIFGKILETTWLRMYKKYPITTISESTKQDLIAHGIPANNISIIPMFANVHCDTIPKKSTSPTLLIIARIAPVKQIEQAITAYTIARSSLPTLKLVIIGKTEPSYAEYEKNIREKIKHDPNITLIANASIQEKQTSLQQSHLLLVTSQKEGYGLVVLEAAACGTPTIGYRVAGIQDAIIHKETGFLIEEQTPSAMAAAICEILSNTSLYIDMQQRAYQHANIHTQEKTATLFNKILTTQIL